MAVLVSPHSAVVSWIGRTTDIPPNINSVTMMGWLHSVAGDPSSNNSAFGYVGEMFKTGGSPGTKLGIGGSGNDGNYGVYYNLLGTFSANVNEMGQRVWHHIAVTANGFYYDGILQLNPAVGSDATSTRFAMMGDGTLVMRTTGGLAYAEIRYWDRVLSQGEIFVEMNSPIPVARKNLNSWFPCYNHKSFMLDFSGAKRHMTTVTGYTERDFTPYSHPARLIGTSYSLRGI